MKIKPKNAVTELKVWDGENSFHYVVSEFIEMYNNKNK
jgi:hypothetical protein